MGEKVVTSLKMDADLRRRMKIEAINRDMRFGEAVEEALREWLKGGQKRG